MLPLQKDAGMVLAARLALYSNDFEAARQYCKELVQRGFDFNRDTPESANEWEAYTVNLWCAIGEVEAEFKSPLNVNGELSIPSDTRAFFSDCLDNTLRGTRLEQLDADFLLATVRAKRILGLEKEAMNTLNQVNFLSFY